MRYWAAMFFLVAGASGQDVSIIPPPRQIAHLVPTEPLSVNFRVDVPLVLIPVQVVTQMGASVTNLKQSDFRLFENNVEQRITHFAKEDAPASIGFVFDSSASMHNKIGKAAHAAAAFFRAANPDDDFFMVEFNDRAKIVVPFTRDPNRIYTRIVRTRAFGRTSLLDAIHLALTHIKNGRNSRRAIVIVSDGGDNCSRYTEAEIQNFLQEADVQVYAIGIFDPEGESKGSPEEKNGPKLLSQLAEETGGHHYPVQNLKDLPSVCERIGTELRNQYLLGYSPLSADRDGTYRRVQVAVEPQTSTPPLRVSYRRGYSAKEQ